MPRPDTEWTNRTTYPGRDVPGWLLDLLTLLGTVVAVAAVVALAFYVVHALH
jgi:hypothetical protein